MIGSKFAIRTGVAAAGVFAGAASATPGAGYVGPGQRNNANAVWCVQKLVDDSPPPAYTTTDGIFGRAQRP